MSGHVCTGCRAWFPNEPALRVHQAYCPVVLRAAGDDDPALTPGRLRHYAEVMRGEGYMVAARLMDRAAAKIDALEARQPSALQALLRYGQHEDACAWIRDTLPCTCGFAAIEAAALAAFTGDTH